jgi:hypothetical protein
VSFETSKTPRSVVLAVSSSTIKRLSEYILLKILLMRSPHLYLNASEFTLTAKKIRIKTRTQRRPVPIVVFEIRSLLVTGHETYQPGVNSRARRGTARCKDNDHPKSYSEQRRPSDMVPQSSRTMTANQPSIYRTFRFNYVFIHFHSMTS